MHIYTYYIHDLLYDIIIIVIIVTTITFIEEGFWEIKE